MCWMSSAVESDLTYLSERQDPRLLRAIYAVAPGTALREGIDNIVHARTGGLIVAGEMEDFAFMLSGGIRLDITSAAFCSFGRLIASSAALAARAPVDW